MSKASGWITTGMRSWMARRSPLASVGDDAGGVDLLAVRADPGLPQAGKGDRPLVRRMDVERPPGAALLLPFVEAVARDQAAPLLHGVLERGLVEQAVGARIEHQREGTRVLDP